MSASTASPALASGPSRPLIRRIGAVVADLVAVAVAPFLVGLAAVERFELIAEGGAGSRFSPEDQARIDEIDQLFNRAIELGGTVYVLSGAGWWWTVSLLAVATLAIHAIVPTLSGGQSPGKTLFGLRVLSVGGSRAGFGQHLLRTLGGLVDVMPLAVPGLLGLVVAGFDPERRRFGDWLGRTVVVTEDPRGSRSRSAAERRRSIDLQSPGAPKPTSLMPERNVGSAEIILAETAPVRSTRPGPAPAPERPGPGPSARGGHRPTVAAPVGWADAAHRASSDRPRQAPWQAQASSRRRSTGFDDLALPESSLAERPLTAAVLAGVAAGTAAAGAGVTEPGTADDGLGTTAAEAGSDPVWSHRCSAWVYHDPGSGRWFRHETGSGRWQPLERGTAV